MVPDIIGTARVVYPAVVEVILAEAVLLGVGQPVLLWVDGTVDLVLRGINLLAPVNLPGVLLTLPDQVRKFVHQANTTTPLPGLVSILPLTQLTAEAVTSGTVPAASHHQDPDQHALILQEVVRGLVLGMIIPAAVAKPQPLAVATILPAHTSMVAHQGITGMDQNV